MDEVRIIGVDLAKHVFQLHGARADGSVAFRRKLRRAQLLPFLAEQPRLAWWRWRPVRAPITGAARSRGSGTRRG